MNRTLKLHSNDESYSNYESEKFSAEIVDSDVYFKSVKVNYLCFLIKFIPGGGLNIDVTHFRGQFGYITLSLIRAGDYIGIFIIRAETNIRNVTNEHSNIRSF